MDPFGSCGCSCRRWTHTLKRHNAKREDIIFTVCPFMFHHDPPLSCFTLWRRNDYFLSDSSKNRISASDHIYLTSRCFTLKFRKSTLENSQHGISTNQSQLHLALLLSTEPNEGRQPLQPGKQKRSSMNSRQS